VVALGLDAPNGFRPLQYAEKDALDFVNVSKQALSLASEPVALVGKSLTRDSFNRAIDTIRRSIKPGEGVILYIAGHALVEEHVYRLPLTDYDTDHPVSTSLTQNDINTFRDELRSNLRVLILDTCYSGTAIESVLDYGRAGVAVFTACGATQTAREDPIIRNGLFTRVVMRVMEEIGKSENPVNLNSFVNRIRNKFARDYDNLDVVGPKDYVDPSVEGVLIGKAAKS
jgi:hypothetical protein